MEYMSSGTPFVGYKLGGIPEEYYEHYYALTDESEETLINAINVILTKPLSELNAKAEDAYHFISEKKSSQYQVARLLEFLKNE
jgi:glycosyltransferase involved in cell wall biosynthesis